MDIILKEPAMKKFHPAFALMSMVFLLNSCATSNKSTNQTAANFIHRQNVYSMTKETYPPKNPNTVSLYLSDKTPHRAYRVIGVATVSKYNLLGHHREDATIHAMMKNLAASIGGDGVINLDTHMDPVKANIIAFQKVLI